MREVLVLGGYGGFGGRVARLLAEAGFAVVVAGRSLARAEAFCAVYPTLPMRPLVLERAAGLGEERPWLAVDAAGPFQGADYAFVRACVAAGCHYLDLADARGFVTGIGALDAEAKAAGVVVLSGASSLPALSGAACDRLAEGLDRVSVIDMALTASNRIAGGVSVTRAILSYAGRPLRLWRGQDWRRAHGWQELGKVRHVLPAHKPLARRVALADVPDLDLLPGRYPGWPAVRFRAGTEVDLQNVILWLLSWPVRWGWARNLMGLTRPALWLQRLMAKLGGDRSAMQVRLKGWQGEEAVERVWTILAERGDGPWIPALAVPLFAAKLDRLPPGARLAAGALSLSEFESAFACFALHTGIAEQRYVPLYARIMGEVFLALPPAVQAMHLVNGDFGAAGMARVERGKGLLARFACVVMRFPPTAESVPVRVWMKEEKGAETWRRDFVEGGFSGRLFEHAGKHEERFGPLRFGFELKRAPDGISMHFIRWSLGPLPMPMRFAPRGIAREYEAGGRFHFDVPIALPLIGPVIHYSGWLTPPSAASAGPAGRPDPRSPPD